MHTSTKLESVEERRAREGQRLGCSFFFVFVFFCCHFVAKRSKRGGGGIFFFFFFLVIGKGKEKKEVRAPFDSCPTMVFAGVDPPSLARPLSRIRWTISVTCGGGVKKRTLTPFSFFSMPLPFFFSSWVELERVGILQSREPCVLDNTKKSKRE